MVAREKEEEQKSKREKARKAASERAKKSWAKRKMQRQRDEQERKKVLEFAQKEAEKAKASALKKAQEEADALAKKGSEEKARKAAEDIVRKAGEVTWQKWINGENIFDNLGALAFPPKLIRKRVTIQEVFGLLGIVFVLIVGVIFSLIIYQFNAQVATWWSSGIFFLWICFGSFMVLVLTVAIFGSIGDVTGRTRCSKN